jgi:serine O-acetyltransferase
MIKYPEFRNLFYHRIGKFSFFINWLYPPMNTLFINTGSIGEGLYIQHGFATIIQAKSIGKNCWINQQVTIGFGHGHNLGNSRSPIIGDNVQVKAGAKIIGPVTIGNNSIIGANAVVVKDVPDNCVVVGVPAYIVKRNGIKTNEKL